MRRPDPSFRLLITGFVLGLLLMALGGEGQTATAQAPSFDSDRPVQSLKQVAVTAESDAQLVALATEFLEARDDTEISKSTYHSGVQYFQQNHPQFYGNFFGDPFYATYDVDYFKMERLHHLAGLEVKPFGDLSTMFLCNPLSYDPAFGCESGTFASLDFFLKPVRYRTDFQSATFSWLSELQEAKRRIERSLFSDNSSLSASASAPSSSSSPTETPDSPPAAPPPSS